MADVLKEQPAEPSDARLNGEYVLSVSPGYAGNVASERSTLVEELTTALRESGAHVAIASPFARGGRLYARSWLARTAAAWQNGFLSIAAHGDVATVIGTIRMFRRDTLRRLLKACPGFDLDCEVVLEARKQRVRIIEVPAELTHDPDSTRASLKSRLAAGSRFLARLRSGLHYRPALWLALPGIVPGVLPLVLGLLLVVRATPAEALFWTSATLVVQYSAIAILSWQTTSFVAKRWLRRPS